MEHPWSPPEVRLLRGGRECARAVHTPAGRRVSRSYCPPYALVASHDGRVGVDLEAVTGMSAAFCASICTPQEHTRMEGAPATAIASLWCSKEALAKALGDALDYDPRRLASPMFWAGGSAGRWRARRLEVPVGYVAWLCWWA